MLNTNGKIEIYNIGGLSDLERQALSSLYNHQKEYMSLKTLKHLFETKDFIARYLKKDDKDEDFIKDFIAGFENIIDYCESFKINYFFFDYKKNINDLSN